MLLCKIMFSHGGGLSSSCPLLKFFCQIFFSSKLALEIRIVYIIGGSTFSSYFIFGNLKIKQVEDFIEFARSLVEVIHKIMLP